MYQLLLQITNEPKSKVKFFEIISEIGLIGHIVLAVILVLSIIAVYIFVERYFKIKKAGEVPENFMNNIRDFVVNGKVDAAKDLCKQTDVPSSAMIEKGLMRLGKPLKNIEVAIENVGTLEIFKLEKNLATLATISGAAPMLGFLGTVTGMIQAFFKLSQSKGTIDHNLLAGGIYEAMITTAAGLAVGIMAYVGYNLLVSMVSKVVHKMEAASVEFIDVLQEPATK